LRQDEASATAIDEPTIAEERRGRSAGAAAERRPRRQPERSPRAVVLRAVAPALLAPQDGGESARQRAELRQLVDAAPAYRQALLRRGFVGSMGRRAEILDSADSQIQPAQIRQVSFPTDEVRAGWSPLRRFSPRSQAALSIDR
jgi:hypothetical protein